MIDVTKVDLVKLAQTAYALSGPQGLGFLHFTEGGLSEEEAKSIVNADTNNRWCALSMDYVHGRSIKLHVRREGAKLVLDDGWYDHIDEQYKELLKSVGIEINPSRDHGVSCNCKDCQRKRGDE